VTEELQEQHRADHEQRGYDVASDAHAGQGCARGLPILLHG
jgi:hypothetical protein